MRCIYLVRADCASCLVPTWYSFSVTIFESPNTFSPPVAAREKKARVLVYTSCEARSTHTHSTAAIRIGSTSTSTPFSKCRPSIHDSQRGLEVTGRDRGGGQRQAKIVAILARTKTYHRTRYQVHGSQKHKGVNNFNFWIPFLLDADPRYPAIDCLLARGVLSGKGGTESLGTRAAAPLQRRCYDAPSAVCCASGGEKPSGKELLFSTPKLKKKHVCHD